MNKKDVKIGKRCYHAVFGWCTITHPANQENKTLVDLECDELSYYVMGSGYAHYIRDKKSGRNILYTPISDLFEDDKNIPSVFHLKRAALNPTLIFWNSPNIN